MNRYAILLGKKPPPFKPGPASEIINFCEAPLGSGLGFGHDSDIPSLTPAQRLILKCLYNTPLDNTEKTISIRDRFNESERFRFTEAEYLNFLYSTGRSNIYKISGDPQEARPHLLFIAGRRGLKSTTAAIIACYEAHKLLQKYCPQDHYHIMSEDEIRISFIVPTLDQAAESFRRVLNYLERSERFYRHRIRSTRDSIRLSTDRDRELYNGERSSVVITSTSCNVRNLRGHNTLIGIFDEFGYFNGHHSHADEDSFNAVIPSLTNFRSSESPGRIICVSSPTSFVDNKLYDLYSQSLSQKNSDWLMFRLPTWECVPSISPQYLHHMYNENPDQYATEFESVI